MRHHCLAVLVALLLMSQLQGSARAARLAVFRLDPLGVEPEIVARLEGLLRMELGRLADAGMPSPREIARLLAQRPGLQNCTGEVGCLVEAGAALRVDRIISGNVGGLAGAYVLNVKMVDVKSAKEVRRIQETITGASDLLIEEVRVAAYRLVAPHRLRGALEVLADVAGAQVLLGGRALGTTPLAPRHGLTVGEHTLRVTKAGYTDVVQRVRVRLQKSTRIVVRLQAPPRVDLTPKQPPMIYPWYTRWWVWAAVGAAAVGVGVALGFAASGNVHIDCAAEPARCGL